MIAVEGGMLHALASRPGQVCSADQLAHWTHRPRNDIVRALRLLTAVGVCDEAGPQSYRANDKTSVLATKGQIGGLRVSSVPVSGIIPKIEEYFTNRATSTQSAAALASPYAYTYGKPMYDVLREDKEKKTAFDDYMEGRKQERKRRWHHTYPTMSELAAAGALTDSTPITIVDVGDLPETVDPIRGETHSFEPMPYDFFTPQPVQGATIYLLLAVLHNWDDDACRAILKNLAAAMKPGYSRLLISGVLLPEVGAERRLADLDMQMWVLQLAQQRTRNFWDQYNTDQSSIHDVPR
ncbi:S-adenosyl-L-methionine-dependent methyltransferase [Aspergillus sclerotioniger CBS 115572]|uniref:S-adenosyl-L-methionine-dependent methyltransferase n=1 Tax=Aspergillus sclerotioniger CBS 115572 TaxID=1450535 RepID=A0A317VC21_9EURO|nr:S-adenosyl-L-methionine-dependent methyltransferase [Aspergillus sclerotioniger CBS 115572]PWY71776.1 S-adenosyl-L-methionine-dependent methyltransferase [Aspergillus sclerotioniger CBS 115572]